MTRNDVADVVVIGSGFGGAFVAHELAQKCGRQVVILERGRRWDIGSFPRRPDELFGNTWDPERARFGLYDVRSFRGVDALVAAGVGGGSLIYANVALRKDKDWFSTPDGTGQHRDWAVTFDELGPYYTKAESLLKVERFPDAYALPRKQAFERAALARGYEVAPVPLAVTFAAEGGKPPKPRVRLTTANGSDPARETCRLCGECILGCNFGAKNSLDHMLLFGDPCRNGIEVRPETLVYRIGHTGKRDYPWVVRSVDLSQHRDLSVALLPEHLDQLHCKVLVLAAGTFGSTELVLRSAADLPPLSPRVGSGFSSNGDLLTFGSRLGRRRGRQYLPAGADLAGGPTITTSVRVDGADGARFYLQDAAIPEAVAWLVYGAGSLRLVGRALRAGGARALDFLGRDPRTRVGGSLTRTLPRSRLAQTMAVLGMGIDSSDGQMRLDGDQLQLSWNVRRSRRLLRQIEGASDDIIQALGGRTWPTTLTSLGRILTVHPVGGLPMGTSRSSGVVDSYGEVFGAKGLFVTDGSVMPGAVGPNPSLTIAAFALRAAKGVAARLEETKP